MKKYLFAALALGLSLPALAQQRPQYSQYMMNNYLLNPAVTGIENFTDLKAGMRRQWVGLDGAPVTYYASVHGSLGKKDRVVNTPFSLFSRGGNGKARRSFQQTTKPNSRLYKVEPHHGIGAVLEMDKMGPLSTKGVRGTYAYHQPLSTSLRLSLGISAGMLQYSLNRNELQLVNSNDPAVYNGKINQTNFDLGLGAWLYASNFYLGFSAQQLLKNELDFSGGGAAQNKGKLQNHFFSTAGVRINTSETFAIVPSVLLKMASPAPMSWDVNLKGVYADAVWAGVSYRHNDAVAAMVGGNITPRISAGYSYDFTTSDLNRVSSGSHEIVVGVKLSGDQRAQNWLPWW